MKILNTSLISGLLTLSLATPALAAMGDDPLLGLFLLDKFETTDADGDAPINWELDAWLGKDLNKFWVKSEGEHINSETEQRNELLYSRAISPFWDVQAGLRQDRIDSVEREFLSIGVQGLAPYLFDSSVSIVAGENDQFGLSAQFEYETMFTQRLILSSEIELDFWSENDPEMGIGSGISTAEIGLRLRYEIRREFAPYIGISWSKNYGDTAHFAAEEGEEFDSPQFVAGVRFWF
jgi:copper resistance protein B